MDLIKTEQDTIYDTDGKCLNRNCNFVGIQHGPESDVKIGSHLNATSWGDLTVVKDEVHPITEKEESVLGMKEEIQPNEECHLRVKDDVHCVATKQKDKPVVKNGICLNAPQGKGPLHPSREEVGKAFTLWACVLSGLIAIVIFFWMSTVSSGEF
jgi:hypothetical protein